MPLTSGLESGWPCPQGCDQCCLPPVLAAPRFDIVSWKTDHRTLRTRRFGLFTQPGLASRIGATRVLERKGGVMSIGTITGEGTVAIGMVRATLRTRIAPGFRATMGSGGKHRFVSDFQPSSHGLASVGRAGNPICKRPQHCRPLPSSEIYVGPTADAATCTARTGTDHRENPAGRGLLGMSCRERKSAGLGFPHCSGIQEIRARDNPGQNVQVTPE